MGLKSDGTVVAVGFNDYGQCNIGSWNTLVTTNAATGIGIDLATLNMSYNLGLYVPVDIRFAYKKSADPTWTYTSWASKSASGTQAEPLTGLDTNTQYDFRAELKFDSTEIQGSILQFTTGKTPPTVTTTTATGITTNSAILNMSYTSGDYSPVEVRFNYKKSADPTWTYTPWVSKLAPGIHAEPLTRLDSDTTYDFKAQLQYDSTVIEGNTIQFTTTMQLPTTPRGSPSPPQTPQLPPADVRLNGITISSSETQPGQPVTVMANLVNNGASTGSYNVMLRINGRVEQQRIVEVSPGTAYPVKFTVIKSEPGTYDVAIEGQRASLMVVSDSTSRAPASGGLIALIAMAVLILATVMVLMISFRRPV